MRGAPPEILRKKEAEWRERYVGQCSGEKKPTRPKSDRYGHPEVRTELRRMSHGKCFYCERKISEEEDEVDHYVEVEERRDLAFAWTNLYLSCRVCNKKKSPNRNIPVTECVDPCAPEQKPADHLSFKAEQIVPRDERGRQTIAKYRLDRDDLDLVRCRLLREFDGYFKKISARMRHAGRKHMTDDEIELLRSYGDPSRPFSLMMKVYIAHDEQEHTIP